MKFVILLSLLAVALAKFETYEEFVNDNTFTTVSDYANSLGFKTFDQQFLSFKLEHNRQYESEEEESRRKFIFLQNLQKIEKNNELYKKGEVTHEMGVGPFADMTEEEYHATFTMPVPTPLNDSLSESEFDSPEVFASLPSFFDWRKTHKVTPVKNQGGCGSCWAFTTIAIVESGYLIHKKQKRILSEQQLVDCMHTNCGGQSLNAALDYVKAHGVIQSVSYPYHAKAAACKNDGKKWHAKIKGYKTLGNGKRVSATTIMNAVKKYGPVGIILDAAGNDFMHYKSGILKTYQGKNGWHAVTIIGWGKEGNSPYWIVKNSWGTSWGIKGYLKLARGSDIRHSEEWVYWPTF